MPIIVDGKPLEQEHRPFPWLEVWATAYLLLFIWALVLIGWYSH